MNIMSANWHPHLPRMLRRDQAKKAVEARAAAKAAVEVEEVKEAVLDQVVPITSAKALDTAIRTPDPDPHLRSTQKSN